MIPLELPEPVKLFVAALWKERAALEDALAALTGAFGAADFRGRDHPFDATDYYAREMGEGLRRTLFGFGELLPPEQLIEAKLRAMEIEEASRGERGRRVNLDPGYLDLHKVVLASAKGLGQKIHLGRGVYADLVLRFQGGAYRPFDWTFPDFRDGRYEEELLELRRRYREALEGPRRRSPS